MIITRQGLKPAMREYDMGCFNCFAEFTIKRYEGKIVHNLVEDKDYISCACPTCGEDVTKDASTWRGPYPVDNGTYY